MENDKVIIIDIESDKMKRGSEVLADWEQKWICRYCHGSGCQHCNSSGFIKQDKRQSFIIIDDIKIKNGSWIKLVGCGDQRPDLRGFGDVIILIHESSKKINDMLRPELGYTYNSNTAVVRTLKLKRSEANVGCVKNINITIKEVCGNCLGSGKTMSVCNTCNGNGTLNLKKELFIVVPPNTKSGNRMISRGKGGLQIVETGWGIRRDVIIMIKTGIF